MGKSLAYWVSSQLERIEPGFNKAQGTVVATCRILAAVNLRQQSDRILHSLDKAALLIWNQTCCARAFLGLK